MKDLCWFLRMTNDYTNPLAMECQLTMLYVKMTIPPKYTDIYKFLTFTAAFCIHNYTTTIYYNGGLLRLASVKH